MSTIRRPGWFDAPKLSRSVERLSISLATADPVCNRDGDTGETLDLRELGCRCNLEYRFAYANYSPPEEVVGTWASVDLAAAIWKLASVALKARRQNECSQSERA